MVCCICFPSSEKKRVHHPNVFSKLKKPQRFSLLYVVSSKTRRVCFVKSAVFFRNSLLKTQQEYRIYNPQKIPEKMIATTFKSWYNEIQTGYNAGFFDKNSQKISTCLSNLFTESAAHAAFRNGQKYQASHCSFYKSQNAVSVFLSAICWPVSFFAYRSRTILYLPISGRLSKMTFHANPRYSRTRRSTKHVYKRYRN